MIVLASDPLPTHLNQAFEPRYSKKDKIELQNGGKDEANRLHDESDILVLAFHLETWRCNFVGLPGRTQVARTAQYICPQIR